MDGMNARSMPAGPSSHDGGFTLIEVIVAIAVLATGVLSLVGVFALGLDRVASSTPMLIAREKAREAVESVHAARDTGELSWATVQNTNNGGVFLSGAQPLKLPGNDGLVNTADDGLVETVRKPGLDGLLNTLDDEVQPLSNYTREIAITSLVYDGTVTIHPNLRQVTVNVRYKTNNTWRTYTLVTYVSSYS
jgi:prepilin-type N-terminal cleavage/methylation domain-containing protein